MSLIEFDFISYLDHKFKLTIMSPLWQRGPKGAPAPEPAKTFPSSAW